MFGLLNSASASSAALRIDWPASPALPGADSGNSNPTLIWPLPMAVCCTWSEAVGAGGGGFELKTLGPGMVPEQDESSTEKPATSAARQPRRRRAGARACGIRNIDRSPRRYGRRRHSTAPIRHIVDE